jgi:hypothetical protein
MLLWAWNNQVIILKWSKVKDPQRFVFKLIIWFRQHLRLISYRKTSQLSVRKESIILFYSYMTCVLRLFASSWWGLYSLQQDSCLCIWIWPNPVSSHSYFEWWLLWRLTARLPRFPVIKSRKCTLWRPRFSGVHHWRWLWVNWSTSRDSMNSDVVNTEKTQHRFLLYPS